MQAYGSDRLRITDEGSAILACRRAKPNWKSRVDKTLTTPEHPGTAVLWEENWWEVVDIEVLQQGVRYTLVPWAEAHAMRFTDRYDAESEAQRALDERKRVAREQGRIAATLLGFITGHLPAAVQEQLASETGINPPRLTQISAIPPFCMFVAWMLARVGEVIAQKPAGEIGWGALLLLYMCADSLVRFLFAFSLHRPMGSLPGLIGYSIFYAASPKKSSLIAPFAHQKGTSTRTTQLSDDDILQSAIATKEPLFSLLDAADQQRVAERFGIDYRKTAPTLAWIILGASVLGVISSLQTISLARPTAALSLLVAAYLLAEQIWRLSQFPHRPAPSVLRFAVRWIVQRYL